MIRDGEQLSRCETLLLKTITPARSIELFRGVAEDDKQIIQQRMLRPLIVLLGREQRDTAVTNHSHDFLDTFLSRKKYREMD